MRSESFPCIICGVTLHRAWDEGLEQQPEDGIMCETAGNYGSTVWDRTNGERLAFNICDPCMVNAGIQGRVMTYRKFRVLLIDNGGPAPIVIGREWLRDRPYVPWHNGLESDDENVVLSLDEVEHLPDHCELQHDLTVEDIRMMIRGETDE
ncbi:MAG: hypothetical protein ABSG46_20450 [Candidatus Binataceae bacterium]|jgi:hypothetical protein